MATEPAERPGVVGFGAFEADLGTRELRKSGVRIKLHGQPFEILAMLLEQPGEVVPREDLRQRLWSTDTFVDFDAGVNTAINRLREARGWRSENGRRSGIAGRVLQSPRLWSESRQIEEQLNARQDRDSTKRV